MSPSIEIFVSLLNDAVKVRRPVRAELLTGNTYRIMDQPYDRDTETWEFEPGEMVVCEYKESSDGLIILAATRRAPNA